MVERSNRPLSPHLSIYKPEITSVLSILHRLSGLALAIGMAGLVWALAAAAFGPEAFAFVEAALGSWVGTIILVGFTVALFYHLANGIRHLFWDAGIGFELSSVNMSGWAVVVVTIVLTLSAWAWALLT